MASRRQHLRALAVAALVTVFLNLPAAPGDIGIAAAINDPGLDEHVVTTYTLLPDAGVVRVRLDVTGYAHKAGYHFYATTWTVHAQATKPRIAVGGPSIRIGKQGRSKGGGRTFEVRYPNLYSGRTHHYALEFDLPNTPPRAEGYIRAGRAFARFTAWSWGDDGDVRIVIPSDFRIQHSGDKLAESSSKGNTILAQTKIADTYEFSAQITAERPSSLVRTPLHLGSGRTATLVSWPEDPTWTKTAVATLEPGLVELDAAIGLQWPVAGELEITEEEGSWPGVYIGFVQRPVPQLRIANTLDRLSLLTAAAHVWFNDQLFRSRWINAGLASEFASRAAASQGIPVKVPAPNPSLATVLRLNGWVTEPLDPDATQPGRFNDERDGAWFVVHGIVEDVGDSGIREVLRRASADLIPYATDSPLEVIDAGPLAPDWRRFLDLVEEVGATDVGDDFTTWVVQPRDKELMEQRSDARARYADLLASSDGWQAPLAVRKALSDWDFAAAQVQIDTAAGIIERRSAIERAADELGVVPTETLKVAYQSAPASLSDAQAIADNEVAALERLRAGVAATDSPRDMFAQIGLWNVPPPELGLDRARAAFAADDLAGVDREVTATTDAIAAAPEEGRRRIAIGVGVVVGVLLLVLSIAFFRRRSRRRRIAATPNGGG